MPHKQTSSLLTRHSNRMYLPALKVTVSSVNANWNVLAVDIICGYRLKKKKPTVIRTVTTVYRLTNGTVYIAQMIQQLMTIYMRRDSPYFGKAGRVPFTTSPLVSRHIIRMHMQTLLKCEPVVQTAFISPGNHRLLVSQNISCFFRL